MNHNYSYDDIIIDEEFKSLLPALEEQTLIGLEDSILEFGCLEPLILWNMILLDGHNRLGILKKHNLPFNIMELEFDSRDEAIAWMIDFQVFRRNLNPMQMSFYRGVRYHTDKRVQSSNQYTAKSAGAQNEPRQKADELTGKTATRLAEHYNVSSATIKRDAQVANAIIAIGEKSPEIRQDILSGKTRISRIQLQELASGTKEDVAAIIAQIEEGTFESRRLGASANSGVDATDPQTQQPWEKEFGKMTDEFRQILRTHAKTSDTKSVKTALRQYIKMLEDLYKNI